jgi:hypothetical protein
VDYTIFTLDGMPVVIKQCHNSLVENFIYYYALLRQTEELVDDNLVSLDEFYEIENKAYKSIMKLLAPLNAGDRNRLEHGHPWAIFKNDVKVFEEIF